MCFNQHRNFRYDGDSRKHHIHHYLCEGKILMEKRGKKNPAAKYLRNEAIWILVINYQRISAPDPFMMFFDQVVTERWGKDV